MLRIRIKLLYKWKLYNSKKQSWEVNSDLNFLFTLSHDVIKFNTFGNNYRKLKSRSRLIWRSHWSYSFTCNNAGQCLNFRLNLKITKKQIKNSSPYDIFFIYGNEFTSRMLDLLCTPRLIVDLRCSACRLRPVRHDVCALFVGFFPSHTLSLSLFSMVLGQSARWRPRGRQYRAAGI